MNKKSALFTTALALVISTTALAQDNGPSDADELKITALEALISAPPERALPLVKKVLQGNHSDEVKESALFILSQIETSEAQVLLLDFARQSSGELQVEAIQMAGIGGNPETLQALRTIYAEGDDNVRAAVIEAYLIAGDKKAIYEIALEVKSDADFEQAVEMLAAMGAIEELRSLLEGRGSAEGLVDAYIVADDFEMLQQIAMDGSNVDVQAQAIEGMGIVGGDKANATLLEIYRGTDNDHIREASLNAMLIADYDEGLLALYRESTDAAEKRDLLEYLTMMDSDQVWALIDEALEDQR